MKIKLTRQKITIVLENNTAQGDIPAWVYNDVLAWHKGVSGQWVLTHIATGYKLIEYRGKYNQLRELTKDISLVSDWQTTCHVRLTNLAQLCDKVIREHE